MILINLFALVFLIGLNLVEQAGLNNNGYHHNYILQERYPIGTLRKEGIKGKHPSRRPLLDPSTTKLLRDVKSLERQAAKMKRIMVPKNDKDDSLEQKMLENRRDYYLSIMDNVMPFCIKEDIRTIKCDRHSGGCGQIDYVKVNVNLNAIRKKAIKDSSTDTLFREAAVLHKLSASNSPYLVQFYCMEISKDNPYESLRKPSFLEEKIDGTSLERVDFRRGGLKEVIKITALIVLALESLHNLHVVHLDIKPGNIMYNGKRAVLIDFGGAVEKKPTGKVMPFLLTTAGYAAPEIDPNLNIKGDLTAGHVNDVISYGSDWFSLGVTLHQMLLEVYYKDSDIEIRKIWFPFLFDLERQKYLTTTKRQTLAYPKLQRLISPGLFPSDAADLIKKLTETDVSKRWGSHKRFGVSTIKKHRFFKDVNWKALETDAKRDASNAKPQSSTFRRDRMMFTSTGHAQIGMKDLYPLSIYPFFESFTR